MSVIDETKPWWNEPLFQHRDPVTGFKNPKPSQVRIVAKSLIVSLNKLMIGEFNKSGKGAKAYHEANVARSLDYLVKHQHLLTRKLMPSGKKLYPKE